MQRVSPDAIICIATYPAAAGFVRDMRNRGVGAPIATISFVGSEAMLALLSTASKTSNKDYTSRLVSSEVVPSYYDDSIPVVRQYREAMDSYGHDLMPPDFLLYPDGKTETREYSPLPYSFVSLEGYLDAKLLVMILRRMAHAPQRAELATTVMSLGDFDLGMGSRLSFGGNMGRRQASDQIYYTVFRDGRCVAFRDGEWEAWTKR
jgi:hypothetical protein